MVQRLHTIRFPSAELILTRWQRIPISCRERARKLSKEVQGARPLRWPAPTSLLALLVRHALSRLVLLLDTAAGGRRLPVGSLVFLLNDGAAAAAAREGNVGKAATLEIVLLADLGTLQGQRDDGKTDAAGAAEEEARSVDGLIALEVPVLVETVVRLAESDAGDYASDQAGVDGVEASEEGRVPGAGGLGRLRVDDLAGLGHEIMEPLGPPLEVLLVDGTTARVLGWGGHFLIVFKKGREGLCMCV